MPGIGLVLPPCVIVTTENRSPPSRHRTSASNARDTAIANTPIVSIMDVPPCIRTSLSRIEAHFRSSRRTTLATPTRLRVWESHGIDNPGERNGQERRAIVLALTH